MVRVLVDERLKSRVGLAEFLFLPLFLGEKKMGGSSRRRSWVLGGDLLIIGGGLCGGERRRCRRLTAFGVKPIPPPGCDGEKRKNKNREHFFLVPVPKHLGLEHCVSR